MLRSAISLLLALALPLAAAASEQLRNVQTELKTQGFYYGEINGQQTPETTAALRRYQIRNGLEVTGTLDQTTLDALGLGRGSAPVPQENPPPAPAVAPSPAPRPPDPIVKSDKDFLRREQTQRPAPAPEPPPAPADPSIVAPPAPLDPPSADLPVLFGGTPYATAPRSVQESTLRRAQTILASRRHYRGAIDGAPGPDTEEALLSYQHSQRLPLTGRLDLETLSSLRLLPGRRSQPSGGFREPVPGQRVYRGIIVR